MNLTNNIYNKFDRDLRIKMLDYIDAINLAFNERKPNYIAEYVYNLCVACNVFYQNNHIANMEDEINKNDWLFVLNISNKIIKEMLYLLGIEIPSMMQWYLFINNAYYITVKKSIDTHEKCGRIKSGVYIVGGFYENRKQKRK